ncbi:MAG TPA: HDIG domain-containing protein, partial [Longimicrobiales bacterium]|nr:HDIG domain-containing protein [Longimicrobiales bacterium]
TIPKTPEELSRDKDLAMGSVPPTFDHVREAGDTMAARLATFFDRVDSAASAGDRAAVERVLRQSSLVATPGQVTALMRPDTRQLLRRVALTAATDVVPQGVVDAAQALDVTTTTVTVREGDTERAVAADQLVTQRQFFDRALNLLPASTPPDVSNLLRLILNRHIEFSYVLNVVATEMDREAVARSVQTDKGDVLQGQAIVRAADPIGPDDLERLVAYESELRARGLLESRGIQAVPSLGAGLVHLALLAVFGLVLLFFRREVYGNFRWLLLIGLLVAAYFGAARLIAANALRPEWLPIAFVALPVAILWDTAMSLVLVFVLAAMTGTLPPFEDYGIVLTVIAGGAAAAMSVRAVRRRSETWVSIAIIAAATGLVLLGHGLATSHEIGDVARASAAAAGNAAVSALLAMGSLWVFEMFTRITTDQTLLEWADPTRPLLKRLSLEAPGTYAHTINVANLCEAAASAIGANGLLARVGVYYHDVGKMLKPHYFVENQPDSRNPHDKLKPATSAAIVREHITEGERLARDEKVPEVIIDFIREHHGTQKIGFFYEKALEEADGGTLDESRFRYPGPKPRSKETAILLLADACESATRALQDPTPERVRELIHNIVGSKVDAGQLSDAPLTLAEITIIEDQFAKILSGVLHRRIEYPATKHLTEAPPEQGAAARADRGLEATAEAGDPDAGDEARAPASRREEDRGR